MTSCNDLFVVCAPPCLASVNSRKDKSLRVMSQKFVMLFLVSQPRVVSLEVAGRILIGEDQVADQDKSKFKSECCSEEPSNTEPQTLDCTAGCEVGQGLCVYF